MTSNKSSDSNKTLDTNIKIKVEPSTSDSVNVPTQRLTSFRIPRDLTLGENIRTKPKKIYAPNINVQRNKHKVEQIPPQVNSEKPKNKSHEQPRGGTKGGRGRNKANIIQSVGVWSEGGASGPTRCHRKYVRYSESTKVKTEKPKLNLDKITDYSKEEEKFQDLFNDNFIDDDDEEPENAPIILPMLETSKKLYKKEEPKLETDTFAQEDKKPIILENGEALIVKNNRELKMKTSNTEKKEINVSQIIEDKNNSLILMRFPENLPGLESKEQEIKPKLKSNDSSTQSDDNKAKSNESIFDKLNEGFLGKLEILESGKARLCLGENNLIVEIGSYLSYHQELLVAKTNAMSLTGELINLGPVNNTLICTPDWEHMLED